MRVLLFVIMLLATYLPACAQLETANWFLGWNHISVTPSGVTTGLPFPSAAFTGLNQNTASISDKDGKLILASNGSAIIDPQMNVMAGMPPDGISGGNKVLILRVPSTQRYYLFYTRRNDWSQYRIDNTLRYTVVDMSMNGGLGQVVDYDIVIDDMSSPSFTVVSSPDSEKSWLVTNRAGSDLFLLYPITSSGLSLTPVTNNPGTVSDKSSYVFHDMKTSFDGTMIAGITYRLYPGYFEFSRSFVEVYDIDVETGEMSYRVRGRWGSGYGTAYKALEFSADNRLLYLSHATRAYGLQPCGFGSSSLTQMNLCFTDSIDFSKYSKTLQTDFAFCAPQVSWGPAWMGADKKMHFPYSGVNVFQLNFPNRWGNSSSFNRSAYSLDVLNNGNLSAAHFTHREIEKAVKNNIVYKGECFPAATLFKISNDTISSVQWDFGDPASGSNTSTLFAPSHTFSSPGEYTVTAQLFNSQGNLIETIIELVEIKDPDKRILYNYPKDTTFCAGGNINLVPDPVVNGIYYWYHKNSQGDEYSGQTVDSYSINYSGTVYVKMLQNDCDGCVMIDSIKVTVLPKPDVNLGSGRTLCKPDSISLNVYDPNADYLWSTGETGMSITIKTGGEYWVSAEYDQNGCVTKDTVMVNAYEPIPLTLPNDTTLCNDQTLLLNPGLSNMNYSWQNASTAASYLVTGPGKYWLTVTDNISSCTASDTILVNYLSAADVNLGADTSICVGASLTLDGGNASGAYLWNTGESTSVITIHAPGEYWLRIDDGVCLVSDTVVVAVDNPPVFTLGNDRLLCDNEQVSLSVPLQNASFQWNNGSFASEVQVADAGIYWVDVTQGACTVRDSIVINSQASPVLSLLPTVQFCEGDNVQVDAGQGYSSYLWNDGSTSWGKTLYQPGEYWVKVVAANGCSASDTIIVLPYYTSSPINLGQDVDLCRGESLQLNAGNGFQSYSWSTGSSASSITVEAAGTYFVDVVNNTGCRSSDTLVVKKIHDLPASFLPSDTAICNYGSLEIKAGVPFRSYRWSSGAASPSLTITQPGTYWLEVQDANHCTGYDTIYVALKECMEGVYVPSAFTPNNDGKNDVFMPLVFGNIVSYSFTVYNRWGAAVFQSREPGKGWDGKVNGQWQDSNVFVWVCTVQLAGQDVQVKRGSVMLVR